MKLSVHWVIVVLASAYFLVNAFLAWNQLSCAVICEEMESDHMVIIRQFSQGDHAYYPQDPELRRSDAAYPPLAFQTYGWVMRWISADVRAIRALRALFGIAAIVLVGLMVYRLTANRMLAFIASGLAAGIDTPGWFMAFCPDSQHLFFAVLGAWLLVRSPEVGWKTALLATLAFFAAFWSKQTGLGYIVAANVYILIVNWRRGLVCAVLNVALVAGGVAWGMHMAGNDFLQYTFYVHIDQPKLLQQLWDPIYFPYLLGRLSVPLALVFAGVLVEGRRFRNLLKPHYLLLGAGAFVGIICSLKYGSGLSQAWFFRCMLIVCGCAFAQRLVESGLIASLPCNVLLGVQLLASAQDFRSVIINQDDVSRYNYICQLIATPGKEVYYNNLAYLNAIVGKRLYTGGCDGCWVKGAYHPEVYPKVWREFFEKDPFDVVILDIPSPDGFPVLYERLRKNYQAVQEIPSDPRNTNSGALRRRKIVFVKKGVPAKQ